MGFAWGIAARDQNVLLPLLQVLHDFFTPTIPTAIAVARHIQQHDFRLAAFGAADAEGVHLPRPAGFRRGVAELARHDAVQEGALADVGAAEEADLGLVGGHGRRQELAGRPELDRGVARGGEELVRVGELGVIGALGLIVVVEDGCWQVGEERLRGRVCW